MTGPLRSGYTTGACAAAAAKAAALLLRDGTLPDTVTITLPTGDNASFSLHSSSRTADQAICSVIKDAGDDPDITNGAEVLAMIEARDKGQGTKIIIEGGIGIGKVTKPGLAVPPGAWAINPVPRQMIEQAVREVFSTGFYRVVISIPDGEERAQKTLNARLGIMGGLSILGTTGIVRPISAKAWTDTIDTALDVAKACNCPSVVLCTGRTSELAAMKFLNQGQGTRGQGPEHALDGPWPPDPEPCFPDEAFIMMGDHIAYALQSCLRHGFRQPVLACQFGKLVKIACGHPNTHAAASAMDLSRLHQWSEAAALPASVISVISGANTAREIALATLYNPQLLELVCSKVLEAVERHVPGLDPAILVCGYDGTVILSKPPITHEK